MGDFTRKLSQNKVNSTYSTYILPEEIFFKNELLSKKATIMQNRAPVNFYFMKWTPQTPLRPPNGGFYPNIEPKQSKFYIFYINPAWRNIFQKWTIIKDVYIHAKSGACQFWFYKMNPSDPSKAPKWGISPVNWTYT